MYYPIVYVTKREFESKEFDPSKYHWQRLDDTEDNWAQLNEEREYDFIAEFTHLTDTKRVMEVYLGSKGSIWVRWARRKHWWQELQESWRALRKKRTKNAK